MKTFKREVDTILTQLTGSPWATHPAVVEVIAEYQNFQRSGLTRPHNRRVSLQIFHASRAIDSLFAHIVHHEASKPGSRPAPANSTLGGSQYYIRSYGIGGTRFSPLIDADIDLIRNDRNSYLHRANLFPSDLTLDLFLNRTIRALGEALAFPP
jgi:hypothetical protein